MRPRLIPRLYGAPLWIANRQSYFGEMYKRGLNQLIAQYKPSGSTRIGLANWRGIGGCSVPPAGLALRRPPAIRVAGYDHRCR